jgi:prevent-host-death family protein
VTIFKTMKETMINIAEAKAKLSEIARRVKNGERIILSDRNRPFAEIRPLTEAGRRPFGLARGKILLPKGFNRPSREVERLFEGPGRR